MNAVSFFFLFVIHVVFALSPDPPHKHGALNSLPSRTASLLALKRRAVKSKPAASENAVQNRELLANIEETKDNAEAVTERIQEDEKTAEKIKSEIPKTSASPEDKASMEKLADVEKGAAEAAAQQELVEEGAFSVANAGITLEAAEKSNSDADKKAAAVLVAEEDAKVQAELPVAEASGKDALATVKKAEGA